MQVVPAAKTIADEALKRMRKRAQEKTMPITKIYMEEVIQTRMNNPGFCTGFYWVGKKFFAFFSKISWNG